MNQVYLLLGSNIGNRKKYLEQARIITGRKIGSIHKKSLLYETEPWGFDSHQMFLNQALEVHTLRSPREVLTVIAEIEQTLGRIRSPEGYASRTLDMDILMFGNLRIEEPDLQIPHPRMHLRKFVLAPLAEIAGNQIHPVFQKNIHTLLEECKDPLEVRSLPDQPGQIQPLHYHFISIEGNIGSGKTSLATKLSEEIDAILILERFEDNPFLPRFYNDPEQYAFPLEMSFLTDRYQQLKKVFQSGDLFESAIISDYFIDKSLIFARQTLNKDEFTLFSRMFRILRSTLPSPDLIIYLYNDAETLKKNILKRGRPYEKTISLDYLDRVQQGYLNYFKHLPNNRILILDSRKMDFVSSRKDYEHIRSALQKQYRPGIHRIPPST